MSEYHKIHSIYKRDMTSKRKTLIEGDWALPEFEYLAGNVWTFTEKVDGTNIRVIFKDGGITFGGRTKDAQIPAQLVGRLNERFQPLAEKLGEVFADGAAVLYGEGYGHCGAAEDRTDDAQRAPAGGKDQVQRLCCITALEFADGGFWINGGMPRGMVKAWIRLEPPNDIRPIPCEPSE